LSIFERILEAISGLDVEEIEIKFRNGKKKKFKLDGLSGSIALERITRWLSNIDWDKVKEVEIELANGEELKFKPNGSGDSGIPAPMGPSGVVNLRFDSATYAIVSEDHSGVIPFDCLALLQPDPALPNRAAAAIDCLIEDGFEIQSFSLIGTNDLIYTIVRS